LTILLVTTFKETAYAKALNYQALRGKNLTNSSSW